MRVSTLPKRGMGGKSAEQRRSSRAGAVAEAAGPLYPVESTTQPCQVLRCTLLGLLFADTIECFLRTQEKLSVGHSRRGIEESVVAFDFVVGENFQAFR